MGLKGYTYRVTSRSSGAWREYPEKMQALNQLIPGLMNPTQHHQKNADWWQKTPAARGGMGGPGGYNFNQIADMYKNYRR